MCWLCCVAVLSVSGEDRLKTLFAQTDSDGDQSLSMSEFGELLEAACSDSPYLSATLRSEDRIRLFHKYDKNGDGGIDVHEFRQLIDDMSAHSTATPHNTAQQPGDTTGAASLTGMGGPLPAVVVVVVAAVLVVVVVRARTKAFPATAQVASQQGEYLAKRLNGLARHPGVSDEAPFNYRHLAQLAYIGGESAAVDLGQGHNISGWGKTAQHSTARTLQASHPPCFDSYRRLWLDRSFARSMHLSVRSRRVLAVERSQRHCTAHPALDRPPLHPPPACHRILARRHIAPSRPISLLCRLLGCCCQVYFSTSVSTRTRALLLSNWIRTTIFGRDVSKQ